MAIGAIGSVISGVLGSRSASKSDRQSRKFARKENERMRSHDKHMAEKAYDYQKDFAQRSAGWQMQDMFREADASGIHRLAALGGPGAAGYSPQGGGSVGGLQGDFGSDDMFLGDAIGKALSQIDEQDRWETEMELKSAEAIKRNELIEAEIDSLKAATSRTMISNARAQATSPDYGNNGLLDTRVQQLGLEDPSKLREAEQDLWTESLKNEGITTIDKVLLNNVARYGLYKAKQMMGGDMTMDAFKTLYQAVKGKKKTPNRFKTELE